MAPWVLACFVTRLGNSLELHSVAISATGRVLLLPPESTCASSLILSRAFFKKSLTTIDLWRRQWQPTPVLLPGKSNGWRILVGCSPWGREESDMTEQLHFHFSLSCTGEGNGNPLQCSCLVNPRDGGAWWAAVSGVAQSRTRLKWLSSSTIDLSGLLYLKNKTNHFPRLTPSSDCPLFFWVSNSWNRGQCCDLCLPDQLSPSSWKRPPTLVLLLFILISLESTTPNGFFLHGLCEGLLSQLFSGTFLHFCIYYWASLAALSW